MSTLLALSPLCALLLASVVALVWRARVRLLHLDYARQLASPPRLGLFVVSLICLFVAAPVVLPSAWDPWLGVSIAVTSYVVGPWSLGILSRVVTRGERSPAEILVALVLALAVVPTLHGAVSAARGGGFAWSAGGMTISLVLYLLGGLAFAVAWDNERGVSLGFLHRDWPVWSGDQGGWWRTWPLYFLIALPIAAIVLALTMN